MNMKVTLINSVIGGITGFILSCVFNYFLIPFPKDAMANAINNGVSGLLAGFIATFMGFVMYFKQQKKSKG